MHPQIPLPFKLQDDFNFNNFTVGENPLIIKTLQVLNEPFVFLWGENSVGKTHLLQAACQLKTQQGETASYLPLRDLHTLPPAILEGMSSLNLVCIDDIDAIGGKANWEEALFNLFNQIKEAGGRLIISASNTPEESNLALKDLTSRLNSGLCLHLLPLDDANTISVLQDRAKKLGLELNQDTANYLITRFPRDLHTLWQLLDQLDKASLAAQRKLTIPFLKTTLQGTLTTT
ncbi:MAG: DnaA regulatory inactivator Hda [Cycloclasticus sp. symbiont of Bathymodiolus heckerae]|nr:MAG: DnaA regulatory inactivator Hda [Cycloclasticus sp. symbiont of Bathymodiolus heckerae]